ncbi:MAG: hypothetical protein RLZZ74_3237 [Cyanobacteriota bacterium]|jgi:hypothetical protein
MTNKNKVKDNAVTLGEWANIAIANSRLLCLKRNIVKSIQISDRRQNAYLSNSNYTGENALSKMARMASSTTTVSRS